MHRSALIAIGALAVVLFSVCGSAEEEKTEKAAAGGGAATVAVLPFKNLCGDASLDWLGVGFAESLATKLANVSGIQLVERTRLADAMKELKLQDTGIVDASTAGRLGKIVGARYVIIGSFQKSGDSIKADARRVEVETSVASSGVEATGKFHNVFDVQSDLAIKLAATLGKTVTAEEKAVIAKPETTSVTAYELNAKGLKEPESAISAYGVAVVSRPRAVFGAG